MTTGERPVTQDQAILHALDELVDELRGIRHNLKRIADVLEEVEDRGQPARAIAYATPQYPPNPQGVNMPISVDSVGEQLILAFTDDHDEPVDAPDGLIVTFAVADDTLLSITGVSEITDPGDPTQDPPVASTGKQVYAGATNLLLAGTTQANVSYTNGDGTPTLGPNGQPIAFPDAVTITINPGAPAGSTLVAADPTGT